MTHTAQHRLRRPLAVPARMLDDTGFNRLAAVSRVTVSLAEPTVPLLALAAASWTVAFPCFAYFLLSLMFARSPKPLG